MNAESTPRIEYDIAVQMLQAWEEFLKIHRKPAMAKRTVLIINEIPMEDARWEYEVDTEGFALAARAASARIFGMLITQMNQKPTP